MQVSTVQVETVPGQHRGDCMPSPCSVMVTAVSVFAVGTAASQCSAVVIAAYAVVLQHMQWRLQQVSTGVTACRVRAV